MSAQQTLVLPLPAASNTVVINARKPLHADCHGGEDGAVSSICNRESYDRSIGHCDPPLRVSQQRSSNACVCDTPLRKLLDSRRVLCHRSAHIRNSWHIGTVGFADSDFIDVRLFM
jgi:hypothetical protein